MPLGGLVTYSVLGMRLEPVISKPSDGVGDGALSEPVLDTEVLLGAVLCTGALTAIS